MSGGIIENERLAAAANSLVEIFRHEQHTPAGIEAKALGDLLNSLKKAQIAAGKLSPNDRMRIFSSPAEPTPLLDLIKATQAAISEPLTGKAKLENLYEAMAFQYRLATGKQATPGRTDTPNLFQQFMAVVVCRINDDPEANWGDYVERTTKAYNRAGQKDKK